MVTVGGNVDMYYNSDSMSITDYLIFITLYHRRLSTIFYEPSLENRRNTREDQMSYPVL